jgi:monoamine oxidase
MNSINNIKIKNDDSSFSVIVIGAGIAGISCARKLYKKGINVLIVEASDDIGGRVKKEENWLDWKILDLGAEFIHGSKTKLKKYCDKYGIATRKMFTWAQGDGHTSKYPVWGEMSMYYIGKDKKLLRWDTKDPDVKKVNDLLWSLWKIDEIPDDKKTLKQYLKDHHISENGIALAEAGYANTVCSSLDFLPLNSVIRLEKAWLRDGGGDYRLHYGMMTVINHMAKNLKIKLNWPVKTINYQDDQKIILIHNKGEKLSANIIVIKVPLLILKHGDIEFIPPLPEDKQLCIKTFNVYNAIKIVMKFSKRFWPVQLQGIICSNCFIPELWFDEPKKY